MGCNRLPRLSFIEARARGSCAEDSTCKIRLFVQRETINSTRRMRQTCFLTHHTPDSTHRPRSPDQSPGLDCVDCTWTAIICGCIAGGGIGQSQFCLRNLTCTCRRRTSFFSAAFCESSRSILCENSCCMCARVLASVSQRILPWEGCRYKIIKGGPYKKQLKIDTKITENTTKIAKPIK